MENRSTYYLLKPCQRCVVGALPSQGMWFANVTHEVNKAYSNFAEVIESNPPRAEEVFVDEEDSFICPFYDSFSWCLACEPLTSGQGYLGHLGDSGLRVVDGVLIKFQ